MLTTNLTEITCTLFQQALPPQDLLDDTGSDYYEKHMEKVNIINHINMCFADTNISTSVLCILNVMWFAGRI